MEYRTGTKVFSNWTIEKELGEGATGKVFEIQKTDYGITTRSALKVIRVPHSASDIRAALAEGMDEQSVSSYFKGFVDEIVKEIRIMTNLKGHPNIVSYEDHHVTPHTDGLGWDILIRMELLTPLYEYRFRHTMQEKDVLRMGVELTDALSFCQKKGLIHRDIKPENIFVSETGQFKLGDFGVARTVEKTTGGLSRKGTEKYMAPEVYLGRPYGSSVDIYSLGLVLYSFLNLGRMPFCPLYKTITYADRENALGRRLNGDILPPPAAASDRAAGVILKACAYRSEDRYHTAVEMHEALKKILYGGQEQTEEPDIHDISEEPYDLEQEEQTVGMVEERSAEPEEKTAGMVEMPETEPEETTVGMVEMLETEPEEKTVGIVESEQKTIVDLLINMPLSVQDHEVYEWLEKRHYDFRREEETAQIRVGDPETSLWTGIIECKKKRDRYIAAALRLTLEEIEESQRSEQFDYLTSTVFSQYHRNSMEESLQGDVRYVYSDNDNLFIVEYTKGVSLEVTRRAPLAVQPTGYREIGTILVNAPLQSRSDTEEWLKDNGFRYSSDKEEQITVYPDTKREFSLHFLEYDGTVHTELFIRNAEEIYDYIKKQIQLSAGEGGIDLYSAPPNERCNENWWWVLNDRILRISFSSEYKLIFLSTKIKKIQTACDDCPDPDMADREADVKSNRRNRKRIIKKILIMGGLVLLFLGCLLYAWLNARNPGGIDWKLLTELPLNEGPDETQSWLDDNGYEYERTEMKEDITGANFEIITDNDNIIVSAQCMDPQTLGNSYFGTIRFQLQNNTAQERVKETFDQKFSLSSEYDKYESWEYYDEENIYNISSNIVSRYTLCDGSFVDIEAIVDIFLNSPKNSTENIMKKWLEENGYSIEEELSDDEYFVVPIRGDRIYIEFQTGQSFAIFEVKNAREVYESIRNQIQEKGQIEYELSDFSDYDEGCTFHDIDRVIELYVKESTGEIYISTSSTM